LGDSAAQDPDRPVVDDAIDDTVEHDTNLPSRHRPIEDQPADRHHRVGDVRGQHLELVAAEHARVPPRRGCPRQWNRAMQLLERAGGSGHVLSVRRICAIPG
jgi:hypothetical protein